jgi:peptidyl-prolyl cis-trans isomerase D
VLQQMRSAAKWVWLFVAAAFVGGFLLAETSGLLGRTPLTPTTAVATVNGHDILYSDWQQRVQQAIQNQQRAGRSLTQDEIRQLENETLEQMEMQALLEQEYRKRGIGASDAEIQEFARYEPPEFLYSSPELQTEGRFDPQKYQRLLTSPQARQTGLLKYIEDYFRGEIPQRKLIEQISDGVYLSENDLWRAWQDEHDSAQVSYVVWRPVADSNAAKAVSDAEARAYFDKHKADYKRTGHAWLSVVHIPRVVSAADTAATRAKLLKLRDEIAGGAKFEDVAKRESQDTVSGANGGDLGRGARGRFVPPFEAAAFALKAHEMSGPVLTPFGYHLIRVDDRKGDTISLRHILLRIEQSDSEATRTDREADSLATMAANAEEPAKLDSAARKLSLTIAHIRADEGRPAVFNALTGLQVPSVSAWAFGGAKPGETSELYDDDNGYWLARLDSIVPGGDPVYQRVSAEVRRAVAREHALDSLVKVAQSVAVSAGTAGFEAAAARAGLTVLKAPAFTRVTFVPGLGQYSEPVGASFGLAAGAVSAPIRSDDGVYVIRVDRRVTADRAEFDKTKDALRQQRLQQLKQQRVQLFLSDLRQSAKIEDHRADINATQRRAAT